MLYFTSDTRSLLKAWKDEIQEGPAGHLLTPGSRGKGLGRLLKPAESPLLTPLYTTRSGLRGDIVLPSLGDAKHVASKRKHWCHSSLLDERFPSHGRRSGDACAFQ